MSAEAMAALAEWIRAECRCAVAYPTHKRTAPYRALQRQRTVAMEKFWKLV